jgi:hypothetical protein
MRARSSPRGAPSGCRAHLRAPPSRPAPRPRDTCDQHLGRGPAGGEDCVRQRLDAALPGDGSLGAALGLEGLGAGCDLGGDVAGDTGVDVRGLGPSRWLREPHPNKPPSHRQARRGGTAIRPRRLAPSISPLVKHGIEDLRAALGLRHPDLHHEAHVLALPFEKFGGRPAVRHRSQALQALLQPPIRQPHEVRHRIDRRQVKALRRVRLASVGERQTYGSDALSGTAGALLRNAAVPARLASSLRRVLCLGRGLRVRGAGLALRCPPLWGRLRGRTGLQGPWPFFLTSSARTCGIRTRLGEGLIRLLCIDGSRFVALRGKTGRLRLLCVNLPARPARHPRALRRLRPGYRA